MAKSLQALNVQTLYDQGTGLSWSAKPPEGVGATGRPIITARTNTTATLEFNAGTSGILSEARYRDASNAPQWFGDWSTEITGGQEQVSLTGLTANTIYEVQTRSTNGGSVGAWSSTTRFRTYATASKAWDIEGVPYPTEANATLTANGGFTPLTVDLFTEQVPADPGAWPSAESAGTYYIDYTHPAATNTSNTYGYPDKPRVSLPNFSGLAAGTVIHVGNDSGSAVYTIPNANSRRFNNSIGAGSTGSLIFLRGRDAKNPPVFEGYDLELEGGSWVVLEHIKWQGNNNLNNIISTSYNGSGSGTSNIILRHCEVTNIDYIGGGAGILTISSNTQNSQPSTTNIFIWDCYVHDNAQNIDWFTEDLDHHGVGISAGGDPVSANSNRTKFIWVVDNWITECSGNGVQVISSGFPAVDQRELTQYIWVAGNRTGDSRQGGLWSKRASHVFFIENEVEGSLTEYSGGNGQLAGCQYNPDYLFYMRNRMRDGAYGIQQTASEVYTATDGSSRGHFFVIENVITDIFTESYPNSGADPGVWRYGTGLSFNSNGLMKRYVFNNTIANCVNGVTGSAETQTELYNNIVSVNSGAAEVNSAIGTAPFNDPLFVLFDATSNYYKGDSNLFNSQGTSSDRWRWQTTIYSNVNSFETATSSAYTDSIVQDPLFQNISSTDLRLQAGSPALVTPNLAASDGVNPYTILNSLYGLTVTPPTYLGALPQAS